MMTMSKPMLAKACKTGDIKLPCYVSPKLDGVRAMVQNGVVYSRTLKPIPNKHVQELFSSYEGFDGELICGSPTDPMCYRKTVSAVMSVDGEPDVSFHVFDIYNIPLSFKDRLIELVRRTYSKHKVLLVPQTYATCRDTLETLLKDYLQQGYEGLIARNEYCLYKQGRSTLKSQHLLKIKPYEDSEAVIEGAIALMHNGNEAFKNELGQTAHSFCKDGLIELDKLGALQVRDLKTGVSFNVGTGFTGSERESLWSMRKDLVGKVIKYKYFVIGEQDKPRHPVYLGFRDPIDL